MWSLQQDVRIPLFPSYFIFSCLLLEWTVLLCVLYECPLEGEDRMQPLPQRLFFFGSFCSFKCSWSECEAVVPDGNPHSEPSGQSCSRWWINCTSGIVWAKKKKKKPAASHVSTARRDVSSCVCKHHRQKIKWHQVKGCCVPRGVCNKTNKSLPPGSAVACGVWGVSAREHVFQMNASLTASEFDPLIWFRCV